MVAKDRGRSHFSEHKYKKLNYERTKFEPFECPVFIYPCLCLQGTDIGPEGASILASSLSQNRSLRTLILRANNIGDSGVNELVESLIHNSTIAELSLERNVLSDQG